MPICLKISLDYGKAFASSSKIQFYEQNMSSDCVIWMHSVIQKSQGVLQVLNLHTLL